MLDKTYNLRDIFYKKFGKKNINLLLQLKEILSNLPVKHILYVGTGMRVPKSICLPEGVETALIIDSDSHALSAFIDYYDDDRIELFEKKIENADFRETRFDTVLFILSLPWIDEPKVALENVISQSPDYIILSNPELSSEQLGNIRTRIPGYSNELIEIFVKFYNWALNTDALMQSRGYYPLTVLNSMSWHPTPKHRLRTVLYTKEKPDTIPYEKAKYIIQVNAKCNFNCPDCYVVKTSETMDKTVFHNLIKNVRENEIICLRGGEPTISENLTEDFIQPALNKGIYVILESNGSFIGSTQYQEYLELLTHKNIEIRLSLDRQHFDFFPEDIRRTRIGWISKFIDDATLLNIKFGLFALGMCKEQVNKFLEEFSVKSWLQYIRPLTKYSKISDLPIRGKFVDINGNFHERIIGKEKRQPWDMPFIDTLEI